ncbi:MAG: GHMP kinase [Flavobacteriaceae bacterium]|nr:GHMP kinase [Flavobacteriaceae bacterium]
MKALNNKYYSNGKLLLTGEYLVLDGTKSLAVPTKFGQDLIVNSIKEPSIIWESYDEQNNCWFQAEFRLSNLRIINDTFNSDNDKKEESIAKTLQKILREAKRLNLDFLSSDEGFHVITNLSFPRNWGLGTSSTLINNIASWAKVDAFELLNTSFGGSGYDIACAQNETPITYQLKDKKTLIETIDFQPVFSNQLYFVHLNVKQNSKFGIKKYREFISDKLSIIKEINTITDEMVSCKTIITFEKLLKEHEQIISKIINNKPIQKLVFSDYFGQTKSLGAWGGDFILATGNEDTPKYFKEKGFETVIPYNNMVL